MYYFIYRNFIIVYLIALSIDSYTRCFYIATFFFDTLPKNKEKMAA